MGSRDETDRSRRDGMRVEDPVPAHGVVEVDFGVDGAGLLDDEDGFTDGEGVVEGLRDGGVGAGGWVEGGEDGGAGGGEEGDCVGRGGRGGH